ncbi:MAG: nuclear transport factor 2 family protein [Gammaproteobacteria bacterium]|nr:nuclear transport factor 2 family protein [Gammaproteobacteria bacterium]MDD9895896.1 nuclear transport factor 2 family protein [Gammaproteobacteria bacterium]MDD9959406.1 nuclear transport factor 2 family protein [Gammaproteobacteria bacterium]
MKKIILLICGLAASSVIAQSISSELEAINEVLDSYHVAASEGDWDTYFELMSDDGVFIGTDAAERWPKEVFREYAGGRNGWTYHPMDRYVNLTPDGNTAWFDEILDSESYGTSRGTGVLIKTRMGWKISQYHLTFPIPNELAREMTDAIKAFEAQED